MAGGLKPLLDAPPVVGEVMDNRPRFEPVVSFKGLFFVLVLSLLKIGIS